MRKFVYDIENHDVSIITELVIALVYFNPWRNTKNSETFKSLIGNYYMLKLTSNVSTRVHFGHFVSAVGNVKYVVATFEYSLP